VVGNENHCGKHNDTPLLPHYMTIPEPLKLAESGKAASTSAHVRVARLQVLDCTRGVAMVFVCLSHFAWSAEQTLGHTKLFDALMTISMVASPTFLLVSGITLGYAHRQSPAAFTHFKAKLRERGVLLLTVAHWLMVPSFFYMAPSTHQALRVLPITDTIGVCLLIGPPLVERFTRRSRLLIGAGVLLATWLIILTSAAHPGSALRVIEGALFGVERDPWWFYSFPVVPWFGLYVIGSVIGEEISFLASEKRHDFSWTFVKWAGAFTVCAIVLELASVLLITLAPERTTLVNEVSLVTNPYLKYPPAIGYFLTYSATGLIMAAITARVVESGYFQSITRRAAELGRSALPIFVVQSYLYYYIELHVLPPRHFWPLYFLGTLGVVYLTARVWLAAGGNALLKLPGWPRYPVRVEAAPAESG
jgi:uncharacterized membrane protein